jgi:hypothetical protein
VVKTGSADVSTAADPVVGLLQLHAADAPTSPSPTAPTCCGCCGARTTTAASRPARTISGRPRWWYGACDVHDVLAQVPAPAADADEGTYLPRPCVLSPEQVVDYLDLADLPGALRDRVEAWSDTLEAERGLSYWADVDRARLEDRRLAVLD